MKIVELTKGQYALVDDEDFEWISAFNWCASFGSRSTKWYAKRRIKLHEKELFGDRQKISMHEQIWIVHFGKVPKGKVIDHINDASLDNQKSNLQAITQRQNMLKVPNWSRRRGIKR